jgi:hypothetical protein
LAEDNSTQYVWVGNQWVFDTGAPRNQDLMYWAVLQFDDNNNILQLEYKSEITLSIHT